jgi:SagB-type dehydrogenase family enzyme
MAVDELLTLLEDLETPQRESVLGQLRRCRAADRPPDEVSLFHESAKVDLDDPVQAAVFRELPSLQAPPMLKTFEGAPRIELPSELLRLSQPVGEAIEQRVSGRDYVYEPLTLAELATLLHYAGGVRNRAPAYNVRDFPFRYSPSAGGLQSIELYVVANLVDDVPKGLYHFAPGDGTLELLNAGYLRHRITNACAAQEFIRYASATIVLTGVLSRVEWKYGVRSYRYVHLDAGIVCQQLYLVGVALGLSVCAVAGFSDDEVDDLLGLDGRDEFSVLLVAVGRPPASGA